jgi:class 3 adenylate cyclase
VIALISARSLSEFISELDAEFGNNAFVLYGVDEVLAHPTMAFDYPGLTALNPLPRVGTFGDPVLSSLWDESARAALESSVFGGSDGHAVALGDEVYAFLYRELPGYSDRPLLIGTYFRSSDLFSEVLRLKWAVIACLGILLASVVTAAATGRRIATPVRRLAEGAKRVHALDLDNVPRIPGSFFKEINDAAESFNSMLDGLRWFERYVPKPLVSRLMSVQGADAVQSMERTVTVMFTDIASFTSLSESIPAAEVAELLNHHFTLVAGCIEAEGGTVDKFIGDSVMAVWGAPEHYDDGPERACRAALAIAEVLRADNAARRRRGERPIELRIGVHTGPVVVGNIGSPGRLNYTVVGDTVNTAKRLDELARSVPSPGEDVRILVSSETARELGPGFGPEYLGRRQVRGREEGVDVFALYPAGRYIRPTAA